MKGMMILVAALSLIGCVSTPPPAATPNYWGVIGAGLSRYRGHDIRELATVVGYPDSQRESLGTNLYSWSKQSQLPMPNLYGPVSFFTIGCHIEVSVVLIGGVEFVDTWRLEGDGRACWQIANALR